MSKLSRSSQSIIYAAQGRRTIATTEYPQPIDERMRDDAARVELIERSILVLLVVGLAIGVLAVVKPFTTAIRFGVALATAAWPMRQALVRRGLGRRPGVAAKYDCTRCAPRTSWSAR